MTMMEPMPGLDLVTFNKEINTKHFKEIKNDSGLRGERIEKERERPFEPVKWESKSVKKTITSIKRQNIKTE